MAFTNHILTTNNWWYLLRQRLYNFNKNIYFGKKNVWYGIISLLMKLGKIYTHPSKFNQSLKIKKQGAQINAQI